MQVATTIAAHEPKQIDGRNGAFTLHIFKTADGGRLQTSKAEKANELYGLTFTNGQPNNAPVTVTYEETKRGQYTNFDIQSSVAGHVPGAATSLPKTGGGGGGRGGYRGADQGVINRSAAVARAIEAHAAGLVKLEDRSQLFAFADIIVEYIEGPKKTEAPTAASAPTTAAPAEAAAPAAPAAAPPAAPATPDDDIPF